MTQEQDGAMADKKRGLYDKYTVIRNDGREKGPYFVLAYQSDPIAARVLAVYANLAEEAGYHRLAFDLRLALGFTSTAAEWAALAAASDQEGE